MQTHSDWLTGRQAWEVFTQRHPELGYQPGHWQFHNFLRLFKNVLVQHDAIRLAKNKFWIAHVERFCLVAFECSTGAINVEDSSFNRGDFPFWARPAGVPSRFA